MTLMNFCNILRDNAILGATSENGGNSGLRVKGLHQGIHAYVTELAPTALAYTFTIEGKLQEDANGNSFNMDLVYSRPKDSRILLIKGPCSNIGQNEETYRLSDFEAYRPLGAPSAEGKFKILVLNLIPDYCPYFKDGGKVWDIERSRIKEDGVVISLDMLSMGWSKRTGQNRQAELCTIMYHNEVCSSRYNKIPRDENGRARHNWRKSLLSI